MNTKPFFVKPGDRAAPLNVVGIQITLLAPEHAMSNQQMTLQAGDEGIGPPPHSHAWDETFYVTKGQVEFSAGSNSTTGEAGTLVYVPAGTVHAYKFGPGGGEMLEITGARSNAAAMFTAAAREIPPGPLDLDRAVAVLAANGVNVHV